MYAFPDPDARGLIPAHAGKTPHRNPIGGRPAAHPRSRGENAHTWFTYSSEYGSSPLTRGKPLLRVVLGEAARLIPAHAGKTRSSPRRRTTAGAHPRSRGENERRRSFLLRLTGSSPLTRGKRVLPGRGSGAPGLIPAHAGKTVVGRGSRAGRGAHPRSRGENSMLKDRLRYKDGSSPLTRGKLLVALAACDAGGLIPAHAGKTAGAA